MTTPRPTTTVRFTDEDRELLGKLQRLTGLDSATAVIRLTIRESLAARENKRCGPHGGPSAARCGR